ncbi:DedA family protein, partial [Rhodococcus sp. CX]|nr:DedA family protein [Rhodococcus sp. CX]
RMPVWRFAVLTTAGSAIWNAVFVLAGFELGQNWSRIQPYASGFQRIVIVVAVVAVAVLVVRRVRRRRARSRSTDG